MSANYKLQCGCMLQDEMAAFDKLPLTVREVVSASPFGTCSKEITHSLATFGEKNYLREIVLAEKRLYANAEGPQIQ